jgi:hypothetical protein
MNRKSENSHMSTVGKCIASNGWLGDIIVGLYKNHYYYIDGTHRAKWLISKGHQVVFTLKVVDSEEELLQLMIDANNVNKAWTLIKYVNSNSALGKPAYKELQKIISDSPHMPVACVAAIFGNMSVALAKASIKKGTYDVPSVRDGKLALSLYDTFFNNSGLGINSRSIEGLMSFINHITMPVFRSLHETFAKEVTQNLANGLSNLLTKSMGAKEYENLLRLIYTNMNKKASDVRPNKKK